MRKTRVVSFLHRVRRSKCGRKVTNFHINLLRISISLKYLFVILGEVDGAVRCSLSYSLSSMSSSLRPLIPCLCTLSFKQGYAVICRRRCVQRNFLFYLFDRFSLYLYIACFHQHFMLLAGEN